MGPVAAAALPERLRDVVPLRAALTAYGELYVKLRFRASSDERAAAARTAVLGAFDRLERELDGRSYLVGDAFTVADLTAAALFYPLVLPPEGPRILTELSPGFAEFVRPLESRPGYAYIARMFAEHRSAATRRAPGRSPTLGPGPALAGPFDLVGDPAAVEAAALRAHALVVEIGGVDAAGVEGDVVAQLGVGVARLRVVPGRRLDLASPTSRSK